MQSRRYSDCIDDLWNYVRDENWDAIANIIDMMRHGRVQTDARASPRSGNSNAQNGGAAASGRGSEYTDIDDLDASDIEILDVADTTTPSSSAQGCPCKGADRELFGLCQGARGLYETGTYPWTDKCYLNIKKKQ